MVHCCLAGRGRLAAEHSSPSIVLLAGRVCRPMVVDPWWSVILSANPVIRHSWYPARAVESKWQSVIDKWSADARIAADRDLRQLLFAVANAGSWRADKFKLQKENTRSAADLNVGRPSRRLVGIVTLAGWAGNVAPTIRSGAACG